MISKKIALLGIITAIMLSITAGSNSISAQSTTLDVNRASDPGPGFGDEKIGTVTIDATEDTVNMSVNITATPGEDNVFEAWLVDAGGSDYKLSLGQVDNGELEFTQTMVNPYTYSEFIITEEPIGDVDPNAADTYAGLELPPPFGQ